MLIINLFGQPTFSDSACLCIQVKQAELASVDQSILYSRQDEKQKKLLQPTREAKMTNKITNV